MKEREETLDDSFVHLVETVLVNLEHGEGADGGRTSDRTALPHLRIVPHPAKEIVGDTGRAS